VSEPLLRIDAIETFYGPIQALRGVSLTVPEGGIVAVLGANGAGKTTILRTVSGVLDPARGEVVFAGRNIAGMAPDRVLALNYGRPIALGTAREVQEHPDVVKAYLGG